MNEVCYHLNLTSVDCRCGARSGTIKSTKPEVLHLRGYTRTNIPNTGKHIAPKTTLFGIRKTSIPLECPKKCRNYVM